MKFCMWSPFSYTNISDYPAHPIQSLFDAKPLTLTHNTQPTQIQPCWTDTIHRPLKKTILRTDFLTMHIIICIYITHILLSDVEM